ncbi:MAG: hypothetical protein LBQ11_03000 [Candidatus Nomurabacteria bacterium]|jgi:hypothetical protein|nr:hypothetical protein [Candidatus Nomurabacteria bacterium]
MSEKKRSVKLDNISDENALAGRDTIYIDTEDDITSIIEKVKESDSSVLALVPPKRVGVLQSVVNLKLLQKAARSGRKKIALITADAALVALAAGLRIPVARNLTTQPELPEAPDIDDTDNDIINGEEIAIGDLVRMAEEPIGRHDGGEDKEISAAVKAIETDDKIKNVNADSASDDKPKKPPKSKRVPDFNSFRKRILIFGSLGLALIIFLVWAIIFAPHGVITIVAETVTKNVNVAVSLRPGAITNIDSKVVQPVIKQIKKTETVDFTATGSKEVGEKSSGEINLYVRTAATPMTISAGTAMTTGDGLRFSLDNAITVSASASCTVIISGVVYCPVTGLSATAANIGENYNINLNTQLSISGKGSDAYAVAKDDFTGGTKETVKIVQKSDLDAVEDKLKEKGDRATIENDLRAQMGEGVVIIDDSFAASYGDVSSKPALNEAVGSGGATATMEIAYTLVGISKTDLENLIEAQLGNLDNQKVYDKGIDRIQFKSFTTNDKNYSVTVGVVVQIGPDLDKRKDQIKKNAVGKRVGEIISDVEAIPGVKSVKVKLSPFWVRTAPAADKLTVEFAVDE